MTGATRSLADDPLLASAPELEGYKVLGGVAIYQKLGQGGMGAVYRGKHIRLNVDVAVKVMAPPPGLAPEQAEQYVRRFVREAQVAAAITHQNLVRVIDVNTESGLYYLVMDFVDGESAGDRLKRKGRLSEVEAVEIVLGAAEGLAEAHRQGIVHRDVKPDNIMIDKTGRVRVTDLGLAKAITADPELQPSMLTHTQTAMGTPYYMSPEQFLSARDVGPPSDVWSLGVTLFQLLTGELPWTDTSVFGVALKVKEEPLPDPRRLCPELSPGVCAVVERAVRKQPRERFADAGDMASSLRAHLDSLRPSGRSVLADPQAGATKLAMLAITPPPSRTLTLIGQSMMRQPGSAEVAAMGRAREPASAAATPGTLPTAAGARAFEARRPWLLPAILAAAGALAVGAVLAVLLLSGRTPADTPSTAAKLDPLELEAKGFFEAQQAAVDAGRLAEAVSALEAAGARYDATSYGVRITRLLQAASARLAAEREAAEKRRREDDARLEELLARARAAEASGDLAGAAALLESALGVRDDPALRERLARIERTLAAIKLLDEARELERAGDLEGAIDRYARALPDLPEPSRAEAERLLAAARRRLALERAIAAVEADFQAKRFREAWARLEEAAGSGLADRRLDRLRREVASSLAPPRELVGPLGVAFVLVPGGTFSMGSDSGRADERPAREVTVSAFYIARFETTRAQLDAFRRKLNVVPPPQSPREREPAVEVAWDEAMAFCKYLSALDGSGATYRLPTEAEWEFAARGPLGRVYPWGNAAPGPRHANLLGRADGFERLAPVGSFPDGATPEGVHDMIGNAAEWCLDWYGPYPAGPATDPIGPASGKYRAVRGSAFAYDAANWSRGSARGAADPAKGADTLGFRVARELSAEERRFVELARQGAER